MRKRWCWKDQQHGGNLSTCRLHACGRRKNTRKKKHAESFWSHSELQRQAAVHPSTHHTLAGKGKKTKQKTDSKPEEPRVGNCCPSLGGCTDSSDNCSPITAAAIDFLSSRVREEKASSTACTRKRHRWKAGATCVNETSTSTTQYRTRSRRGLPAFHGAQTKHSVVSHRTCRQ